MIMNNPRDGKEHFNQEQRCPPCPPPGHYLILFPKWPHKGSYKTRDACKVQHTPHRKARHGIPDPDTNTPILVSDQATMDHIIYGEGDQSQRKCKVALVCYDRATHWLGSFPTVTVHKTSVN